MGRNCVSRHVQSAPAVKGFRPFGRLGGARQTVVLSLDEFEAIRLLDYQHLNQEEAAAQMQISRPTLTRIYEKARIKYATALVEGCILIIEGGEVHFTHRMLRCRRCHGQFESMENTAENCPHCHSRLANLRRKSMKIAIPSTEEKILCPHFGHAPYFAIIEINDAEKTIVNVEIKQPEQGGHDGVPPWLQSLQVTALIAGGLGKMAIDNLQKHNIDVYYGAPELPVTEITELWLKDKLTLNPQPCNHHHDHNCEHDAH